MRCGRRWCGRRSSSSCSCSICWRCQKGIQTVRRHLRRLVLPERQQPLLPGRAAQAAELEVSGGQQAACGDGGGDPIGADDGHRVALRCQLLHLQARARVDDERSGMALQQAPRVSTHATTNLLHTRKA